MQGNIQYLGSDITYEGEVLTFGGPDIVPKPTFGLPPEVVALMEVRFGSVANFLRLRNLGQV